MCVHNMYVGVRVCIMHIYVYVKLYNPWAGQQIHFLF